LVVGDSIKEELVVYRVPSKLLAGSKEQEGLTNNRDFGLVAGTVSAGRIRGVEFQGHERLVTCREELLGVKLWEWGEEDLINRKAVFDKFVAYPEVLTVDGDKCHVGGLQNVGKVNLGGETAWSYRTVKGAVSSLHSDGEGVWVGQDDGVVCWVDWRVEGVTTELRLGEGVWDTDFLSKSGNVLVVGVNNKGCISMWDTRHNVSPVKQHALCLRPTLSKVPTPHIKTGGDRVLVSVSDTVSVYQAHDMTKLFTHDGHQQKDQLVNVTSMNPHPTVDRLVISGDDKQSLHAWIYNPDTNNDLISP